MLTVCAMMTILAVSAPPLPMVAPPTVVGGVVVDGALTDAAWGTAQQVAVFRGLSGGLPASQPVVLVCRDAVNLYVGASLPKPKGTLPKMTVSNRDGMVWEDDALEVFINPGATGSRYYQFIANAAGTQWDSAGKDGAWNASWQAAGKAVAGDDFWTLEMAIPFAAMDAQPKDGSQWGFNVAWDRQTPSPFIASWAVVQSSLHEPQNFGRMLMTSITPLVREARVSVDARRGEITFAARVIAGLQPVALRMTFGTPDNLREVAAGLVEAGHETQWQGQAVLPLEGGLPAEQGDFLAVITATVAGNEVYRTVIPMAVTPPMEVKVHRFVMRTKKVQVEVDATALAETQQVERVEAAVLDGKGAVVASVSQALGDQPRATFWVDVSKVDPGEYKIRTSALGADGAVVHKAEESLLIPETPEWLGNREGISDAVLPPWTPLTVEGRSVKPWGREYRWGALPFPESVVTRNAEVLAGPICLVAVVDGQQQAWMGNGPTFTRKTPARVEFSVNSEGQSASMKAQLWCEYDGCVRCDWELKSKGNGARLDRLVFEIPIKAEHAKYIYHYPGRWGSAFNAGALPKDGLQMGFRPFVWLGDEERGFSWFCTSDEPFRPLDAGKITEVLPEGNVVVLRVNLVEQPCNLKEPFRATFGFEATPVRHNPKDVWDYRIIHTGNYGLEQRPWAPDVAIHWPAAGNIDLAQGTLEAWVRPNFDPDPPVKPDDPGRGAYNREFFNLRFSGNTVGFYWNIDDRGMRMYLRSSDQQYPLILGARNDWKQGEWHHIALSWGEEVRLYGDGKLLARREWKGLLPGDLAGGTLSLGGGMCEFDVDDFCISNIAREPRGQAGPLQPDDHTLLLENFDRLGGDARTISTVPAKALGGPGTITGPVQTVDGKFGSAVALRQVGPQRTAMDMYEELGVRTICFHEHWSTIQNYFAPADPEALHSLVKACHDHGISLLVYYGYELANIAPEWETYGDEILVYPRAGGYRRQPEQIDYICCYASAWQDYIAWAIARTMDEFDMDGVYLDGTANPWGCANLGHGCGYIGRDGKVHPTYTFFETREMMKRIYTIVKSRKPYGQVNVHQSTCMTIPSVGWATSYWDGEQFGSIEKGPDAQPLTVLPLDAFRAEFMGHNWGVPAELLCYGRPYTYPEALAISLPHDVLVRPNDIELASKLWKAAEAFGRREAQWIPYWANQDFVRVNDSDVKCSLYSRGSKGLLMVVSNLGREPVEARLRLDRRLLELPAALQGRDVVNNDEPVECENGRLTLTLQPLEFRMIRIDPAQ